MFETFKQDVQRWVVPGKVADPAAITLPLTLKLLYRHMSLRAVAWFRLGTWCKRRRVPFMPGYIQRRILRIYGLEISPGQDIGGGLYIAHPVGTVIYVKRIGRNCSIIAAVTIGMRNTWEFPVIGDDVFIGAGARVLGAIRVGNQTSVGANAVVLEDTPEGATVVGIPGKVIRIHGKPIH
jgi:serine O-acetyltransferase